MKKINLLLSSVFLLTSLASLSGCGQRGPLYLPEKKNSPAPTNTPTNAPTTAPDPSTSNDKKN
ncbi:lipoprotein [Undibacterium cyanobacteriorum]|uniref:Lipoprotein n=1 Tax=Undibacterium cyanobacteriorum TaxID=3073561 RepID=A0ABY9RKN7_9BURK|nr:lipoprotein [Undibacterium sp. 20NA77.5]WMW81240.1 lipoprotein [Undibacterium sp. 20NA77.5]